MSMADDIEDYPLKPETMPCKWCNSPTRMFGTQMCDRCWELEHRIKMDPELSRKMLEKINHD